MLLNLELTRTAKPADKRSRGNPPLTRVVSDWLIGIRNTSCFSEDLPAARHVFPAICPSESEGVIEPKS